MDEYIICPKCHNPRCQKDDHFCFSCGFDLDEEATPADSRETRYEEYKRSITGPLGRQMYEKKRDTVYSYTNVSGNSDSKLIVFGFLSGIALACAGRVSGIAGTALIVAAAACFLYALYSASENRRKRGEDAFYRYVYDQIISEQVRWDRSNAERLFLDDTQLDLNFLARFASPEAVDTWNKDEFRQRRILVEEYDYYEKQLQQDYQFSKTMHDAMK